MASTTNKLCPLCCCFLLKTCCKSLNAMSVKVEKYLQIKIENKKSEKICLNCYNSIQQFHEFYERVHLAQKNFSNGFVAAAREQRDTSEMKDSIPGEKIKTRLNTIQLNESVIDPTENKANLHLEDIIDETNFDSTKNESKKQKVKPAKFKEKLSDMEKKMIEFYNIKCEKCENGKFTSFKMLSKHYTTVHNTQGYIKCCKRNIRINDKYYLRNHMYKHLQPDTCRCRICGKELSSLATLKRHMMLHKPTEERPFQCSKCAKRFCSKTDVKNHEKAIHVPESEKEDYICDVCGKVFQKIANLRYHLSAVHVQEKKYICEICAKGFITQSGLRTHNTAAHSTSNPIQCHECNKWLKTKDTFQKHLQLHQSNKYPCTHCNKVCNSSSSLRSHLIKHSDKRPHSCEFCKKSFKTRSHLKNHSNQHLEGSRHKCPYCSKLFVNLSNYYTHRRRMHSVQSAKNIQNKQMIQTRENASEHLNLKDKNNFASNYGIIKSETEIHESSVKEEVPELRQSFIVSPVIVEYF